MMYRALYSVREFYNFEFDKDNHGYPSFGQIRDFSTDHERG